MSLERTYKKIETFLLSVSILIFIYLLFYQLYSPLILSKIEVTTNISNKILRKLLQLETLDWGSYFLFFLIFPILQVWINSLWKNYKRKQVVENKNINYSLLTMLHYSFWALTLTGAYMINRTSLYIYIFWICLLFVPFMFITIKYSHYYNNPKNNKWFTQIYPLLITYILGLLCWA